MTRARRKRYEVGDVVKILPNGCKGVIVWIGDGPTSDIAECQYAYDNGAVLKNCWDVEQLEPWTEKETTSCQ